MSTVGGELQTLMDNAIAARAYEDKMREEVQLRRQAPASTAYWTRTWYPQTVKIGNNNNFLFLEIQNLHEIIAY